MSYALQKCMECLEEIRALRAINAELLAALKVCAQDAGLSLEAYRVVVAAVTKAEGK